MARGRKADPQGLQDLKGNPGRRPNPEDQLDLAGGGEASFPLVPPEGAEIEPPEYLDEWAKVAYRRLAPDLVRIKLLTPTDEPAFERYCRYLSDWWRLDHQIRTAIGTDGLVYVTESNHGKMERLRSAAVMRDRIEGRLESLEDRYGMSPRARQEIFRALAAMPNLFPGQPGAGAGESTGDAPADPAAPSVPAIGFAASSGSHGPH